MPKNPASIMTHSVAETESAAATLAKSLVGGEVVALHGELGAGKTQFARGVVKGLGGDPHSTKSRAHASELLTASSASLPRTSGRHERSARPVS